MTLFEDSTLDKLSKLTVENHEETLPSYRDDLDFTTFFDKNITDKLLKTMVLEYDKMSQTLKIQTIKNSMNSVVQNVTLYRMTSEAYLSFCSKILLIDRDKRYNDSTNLIYQGVNVRVFAIMSPYKDFPLIVMSTAKEPPDNIDTLSELDEKKLTKVLKGNFLLAGKSGAGKTYLMNYLLTKYYPKNERVGIIQEFSEIIPPNNLTDTMCTPPRVPGQTWNDLEFLTEQSNLMRYDRIIVGEIKSSEAWPFVVNCASGTKGAATIHGTSTSGALQRLKTLCLLASTNIDEKTICSFIKDAIDYVVYIENAQVKNIDKVTSVNHGIFQLEPLEIFEDGVRL